MQIEEASSHLFDSGGEGKGVRDLRSEKEWKKSRKNLETRGRKWTAWAALRV